MLISTVLYISTEYIRQVGIFDVLVCGSSANEKHRCCDCVNYEQSHCSIACGGKEDTYIKKPEKENSRNAAMAYLFV